MGKGTLKQILLITDGCSNQGEDPVISAGHIFRSGIVVNVIGILDDSVNKDPLSYKEIDDIAKAGGGVSEIIYKEELSHTVQAVTRQAMSQTLQGIMNERLTDILGKEQNIEQLEPEKRGDIIEVVEELEEACNLEVLILVDTSASMHHKLPTVKEALLDLSYNLQARLGNNLLALFQYPGTEGNLSQVVSWTKKFVSMEVVFPNLITEGMTPTGPALRDALKEFAREEIREHLSRDEYKNEWG